MNNYSLEAIEDLLAYLDLHIVRYQYKVLTTEQKNMLADLVDASCAREAVEEGYAEARTVDRWWLQ